ncbi:MAG: hypothetical protein HKN13_00335, partial [Rhodothermales bacterium]|nr:hypothetical protein [Rhodothermales bacterium]
MLNRRSLRSRHVSAIGFSAPLFVVAALLGACGTDTVADTSTVVFAVDMSAEIERGDFDPDADRVGVRGDVLPLSWGESQIATDPDGDRIFELAVRFEQRPVSPIAFKFKIERTAHPNDGWQVGANRSLDLEASTRFEAMFSDSAELREPSFSGVFEFHEDFKPDDSPLRARNIFVYLPPGYGTSDTRYPVLYMHDGRNIFDASEVGAEWGMDEYA